MHIEMQIQIKLMLWETQLTSGDAAYFPCLRDVCTNSITADMRLYKDNIAGLFWEFEKQFSIFSELTAQLVMFHSPFTVKTYDKPVNIRLEIIDLQCNVELKEFFFLWAWTYFISISSQGTLN